MKERLNKVRHSTRGKYVPLKLCPYEQKLAWAEAWKKDGKKEFKLPGACPYDPKSVIKMCQKFKERGWVPEKTGRTGKIDRPAAEKIKKELKELKKIHKNLEPEQLEERILDAVRETAERSGGTGSQAQLPKSTFKRLKKKWRIVRRKAVVRSKPRAEAVADPLNYTSLQGALDALNTGQSSLQHMNMDQTQYCITMKKDVMMIEEVGCDEQVTLEADSSTCVFIKRHVLVNAQGSYASPIFIIASPGMKDDDFDLHEIMGLTQSSEAGSFGYLVFTKTRAGNRFSHYQQYRLVMEFDKKARLGLRQTEREKHFSILTSDGEASILQVAMTPQVQKELEEAKIHAIKLPASCSLVSQACDLMNDFRGTKSTLRAMANNTKGEDVLMENIWAGIEAHRAKYPKSLSSEIAKKVADGLGRIVFSMRKNCRPNDPKKAFEKAHQFPQNYDTHLELCTTKLKKEEWARVLSAREAIKKEFQRSGQCADEVFAKLKLRSMVKHHKRKTAKNDRTLHQQRAVILTHEKTRQRYDDYKHRDKNEHKRLRNGKKKEASASEEDDSDGDADSVVDEGGGGSPSSAKKKAKYDTTESPGGRRALEVTTRGGRVSKRSALWGTP